MARSEETSPTARTRRWGRGLAVLAVLAVCAVPATDALAAGKGRSAPKPRSKPSATRVTTSASLDVEKESKARGWSWGQAVRGEVVTPTKNGLQTVRFQRGVITSVSDTTIVVTSIDGYARTWTITAIHRRGPPEPRGRPAQAQDDPHHDLRHHQQHDHRGHRCRHDQHLDDDGGRHDRQAHREPAGAGVGLRRRRPDERPPRHRGPARAAPDHHDDVQHDDVQHDDVQHDDVQHDLGGLTAGPQARPRTAFAGARSPRIDATMSNVRRVATTSWARKTLAPHQAATAVAARVPSSRSSTARSRVSPTKSLRESAMSTG